MHFQLKGKIRAKATVKGGWRDTPLPLFSGNNVSQKTHANIRNDGKSKAASATCVDLRSWRDYQVLVMHTRVSHV